MTIKKMVLGLSVLVAASTWACASPSAQQNKEGTEVKETLVRNIDAAFMRQNIFDYKENPTKFVFKGKRPAILDFYADWCPPCRALSPKLTDLAKKYKGEIDIYKINVDDEGDLAKFFGVKSIPMLLFIPMEGTPIQTLGNLSVEELEQTVAKIRIKK
ncbi:MAG: thioredoxin domain-containing protein [Porphyromonadaceae bacterium]|nr:thioredoxin domain-containing protein [Porphyromonadaceae bacterium]